MTFACTDCSRCGKCYENNSICAVCGGDIYLLDSACPTCGEPITDKMRAEAKREYIDRKRVEHEQIVQLAIAAKKKRDAAQKSRPKYPWEDD